MINQGKHLSREPSTEVPLLSHFSMHVATLRSFYKVLINTTDKSCENGNVISVVKMRKEGVVSG